jgi:predicted nucleotidyltransferase
MPLDNTPIILAQIADILREYPQASRGILFGSRAMGTARSGSDIDIAIM